MKSSATWVILLVLGLVGTGMTGYWLGMKQFSMPVEISADKPIKTERKILYYRNPMGLPDISSDPKKDSMGMDYIPVYADEENARGQIKISLDKVQKLGVRTELVAMRPLTRKISAVGRFEVNERRQHTVTSKFEGYIENLFVNATGQSVKRGQPLMEVYSPELVSAQEEYLIAWNGRQALKNGTDESVIGVNQLAQSALKRLRNWDISHAQLQRLQQEGKAERILTIYSPASGVVMEKTAIQGMHFMPGKPLFEITDLSRLWLVIDIFEQDLAQLHVGQSVNIQVDAYPEKKLSGKISFIYPTLEPDTRTTKVRIELANPDGLLRPDMYANVQIDNDQHQAGVLTVPNSAIIDDGSRQIVIIQRAPGLFEPRNIAIGTRGDGYVEVLSGLNEGEKIVVSANFLIDAESNLKAAISSFDHRHHHDPLATSRDSAPVVDQGDK